MRRAACLAWLGCTLSLGLAAPAQADRLPQQVSLASAGWPLGDFALIDQRGAPFTQENLRGRWTLLLLGDGHCRAPCEAALAALAGLFSRIRATQAIQTMQVVLVLPASEATEGLGPYLARFDPRFIGAQGSRRTLQGLADDLGVTFPGHDAGSIWVIAPDGILRSELLPPFDVKLLTAEFMRTRSRR
jgi:protein SCO1/2